jgi:hypothetical protein
MNGSHWLIHLKSVDGIPLFTDDGRCTSTISSNKFDVVLNWTEDYEACGEKK